MLRRGLTPGTLLALCCALLAGCGGGGGRERLSTAAYRSRLAQISREANRSQAQVEKALQATTMAELRTRLRTFATAEQRLGDEVAALEPPKDAVAANARLARGEHELAAALRQALPRLARFKTTQAVVQFLNAGFAGAQKGARDLDGSLAELKRLGYTKGS